MQEQRYGFGLMSATNPSICVVLAVTSDTAFLDLQGVPNLIRTIEFLDTFFPYQTVLIAVSPADAPNVREVLDTRVANYELLISQPLEPAPFSLALEPFFLNSDAIIIHDASRPLTSKEQFERVLTAFDDDIDAVRPVMPFTETLKILGSDSVIKETLDRSSVLKISTPELIRVSAIDIDGPDSGWFLPLIKGARTTYTEGGPEGLRINTTADRDLMELHQI